MNTLFIKESKVHFQQHLIIFNSVDKCLILDSLFQREQNLYTVIIDLMFK